MSSTYSPSLQIQLMGNGDQSGTWGTTTNTNWGLVEAAIAGAVSIVMSNANRTLTNYPGITDEARNMTLIVSGSNSAVYQVIAPLVPKIYNVVNNTTGGYAITIGGATGATVSVPNGYTCFVYCDGTNFYACDTSSGGNFYVNGTLTVTGAVNFASTIPVASGGTGATTLTGVLYGNGTGAFTAATGAQIASAIGTNAVTNATNATKLLTTDFSVQESGGKLYFYYGATQIASLDSSGNFTALANVTAYGTP
jgi:hypothetical protein